MDGRGKGKRILALISRFENLNCNDRSSSVESCRKNVDVRKSLSKDEVQNGFQVKDDLKRERSRALEANVRKSVSKDEFLKGPQVKDDLKRKRSRALEANVRKPVPKDEVLSGPQVKDNLKKERSKALKTNVRKSVSKDEVLKGPQVKDDLERERNRALQAKVCKSVSKDEILKRPQVKNDLEKERRRALEAMRLYHEEVTCNAMEASEYDQASELHENLPIEKDVQDLQDYSETDVEVLRTSSCSEKRTYTSSLEIFIDGSNIEKRVERIDSSYYSNDEDEEDEVKEQQPKLLPRLTTRPPLKPKPHPGLPKKARDLVYENFALPMKTPGENIYENVFVKLPDVVDPIYDVPRVHTRRSMSLPEVIPLRKRCDSEGDSELVDKSSYPKYENVILYLKEEEEAVEKQRCSKNIKEHIVDELVETEKAYQEKLRFVIENYVYFLRDQNQHTTRHKHIFLNIENIYLETQDLLRSLEVCGYNYCEIGNAFLKHKNLFDRYPVYCKNKLRAMDVINKIYKEVLVAREEELGDRLGLNSHLLVPIQRITKYELLLQKLCSHLAKENDLLALERVEKALVLVKRIAHRGNDLIIIDSIVDNPHTITETGDFLMMDSFRMLSPKKMDVCLFLFNKTLIFASRAGKKKDEYIYYTYIPVDSLYKKAEKGLLLTLEDFNMKKRHSEPPYTLEAKDQEMKKRWTSKIDEMLWSQYTMKRDETKRRFEPSTEIPLVILQEPEAPSQQEVAQAAQKRKRSIFKKQ